MYFVNIEKIEKGPKRYHIAKESKTYSPLEDDAIRFSIISRLTRNSTYCNHSHGASMRAPFSSRTETISCPFYAISYHTYIRKNASMYVTMSWILLPSFPSFPFPSLSFLSHTSIRYLIHSPSQTLSTRPSRSFSLISLNISISALLTGTPSIRLTLFPSLKMTQPPALATIHARLINSPTLQLGR